jgi:hypothetical protein
MLEEIEKEEYVVVFCDKVVANEVYIKKNYFSRYWCLSPFGL